MKLYQRLTSFVLALGLLCGLLPSALAAEAVTPTPPEWMPEEHYLIFPGDEVYQSENWEKVLAMREDARNGGQLPQEGKDGAKGSAGMCYEIALVRLKYAENAPADAEMREGFYSALRAFNAARIAWHGQNGKKTDALYYQVLLWEVRCSSLYHRTYNTTYLGRYIYDAMDYLGLTLDDFFDAPYMERLTEEDRAFLKGEVARYRSRIIINLDGGEIVNTYMSGKTAKVEIKQGRVMIPLRLLAEHLGAEVTWNQASQQIMLTCANVTVAMTVGKTTATVDGVPVEMDVAPYVVEGSTLIPARYLGEFFGQTVEWNNDEHTVYVTENKSVAGDSNLETWALTMGAMREFFDTTSQTLHFGQYSRSKGASKRMVSRLNSDWSIESREDLIDTVLSMTEHGHNDSFQEAAAIVNSLSSAQYNQLLAQSGDVDKYMWPQTKDLSKKWGDTGILAWDLSRMSNLVQWGYTAGYVTYAEALALVEPAAQKTRETFTSWEEFYENYLDGYNWWARNDMTGKELWTAYRGTSCRKMLSTRAEWFDDTLFTKDVISLPNLTAQQIWDKTFPQ